MVVALGAGLRWIIDPAFGEGAPLILYYFTVVLCAWYGGLWQGLLGAALSAFIAQYLFIPFIPSTYSFANKGPHVLPRLITYLLTGAVISFLAEILHRARKSPQENEADAQNRREELGVTLSSIGDAVMATDAKRSVSFMNPVAEFLTRWKRKGAPGKLLEEAFHIVNEQMRERIEHPAPKVIENGLAVRLANHNVLISRDVTERPIDSSAAPILDKERRLVGVLPIFRDIIDSLVGVAADITDRKNRDEEIRRLNAEMQERLDEMNTLLEILPVGVWIGNQDCSQINGNPAAHQIMGLTPGINVSGG
ncbi:MAG: DUF4118 domain-containing protein, partial [Blastocatellia bacterium]|nr:DUF4118 domain-containing protein [Blastocatellia bacterium]